MPLSWIAIALANRYQQHLDVTVWLNSLVQFQFFALGALLALGLSGRVPRWSTRARIAVAVSGVVCWMIASGVCFIKDPHVSPSTASLAIGYELVAGGCLCFALSLLGSTVKHIPRYVIYLAY